MSPWIFIQINNFSKLSVLGIKPLTLRLPKPVLYLYPMGDPPLLSIKMTTKGHFEWKQLLILGICTPWDTNSQQPKTRRHDDHLRQTKNGDFFICTTNLDVFWRELNENERWMTDGKNITLNLGWEIHLEIALNCNLYTKHIVRNSIWLKKKQASDNEGKFLTNLKCRMWN